MDEHVKADRTRSGVQSVCQREPALDYLVLARPIEDLEAKKVWVSPARLREEIILNGKPALLDTNRFYLYSCADLR
jgi:hypothetical protein